MREAHPLSMFPEDETSIVEKSVYGLCSLFHDLERRGLSLNQRQAFMISFTDDSVRACALSPPEEEYSCQRIITLDVIKVDDEGLSYDSIGVYDINGDETSPSHEASSASYLSEYVSWVKASISGATMPRDVESVNVLVVSDETIPSIIRFLDTKPRRLDLHEGY